MLRRNTCGPFPGTTRSSNLGSGFPPENKRMESAKPAVDTQGPSMELAWSRGASTKFRVPGLRRDVVAREALVRRARELALDKRVTLVQAPGGAGKSTLMAQIASSCRNAVVVWLSLDEDDNDANRLFASLLMALREVDLEWEVDQRLLTSQVNGFDEQSRAAVNLLVNALCSFDGERLIICIDDLHRITDADALGLLDHFIERLPPEVGMLIGTRVSPDLSLARWRTRGELGELQMADLQFDERDTQALAGLRLGERVSGQVVSQALQRTQGWVAGLQLLLAASHRSQPLATGEANRHTFDFLAHEVIGDLPPELREFAKRCAVLHELSPAACAVVTGSADTRRLLDELYRRNLFLTVIDDVTPVLRLHDLFREFLLRELERSVSPQELRELHARAARAAPSRAVTHWLKAEAWDEAVEAIARCAEPLLAEGGHALVERWIRQLPDEQQQNRPEIAHLLGLCVWTKYDTKSAHRLFDRAAALYRERRDPRGLGRVLPLLARMCNTNGDLAGCDRIVAECESLDLDSGSRALLIMLRVWNFLAAGRAGEAVLFLRSMVEAARQDSSVLYPAIVDLFNSFGHDAPGASAQIAALKALCRYAEEVRPVHWQVSALAHSGWPEFCSGDYAAAVAALADRERFQQRHAALAATWLDINQLRAAHAAASGRPAESLALLGKSVELLRNSEISELRESWLRPVLVDAARFAWIAEDAAAMRAYLSGLEAPRAPTEWPGLATGVAMARGRLALLEGRFDDAERELHAACRLYGQWPCLLLQQDPLVALAFLRLAQGRQGEAWEVFAPVWQRALEHDAVGLLLLEPAARLSRLLDAMPVALRDQLASRRLLDRLAAWKQAPDAARQRTHAAASLMATLSDREREVLACIGAGHSNKLIARSLDLSPHTVKRHVANILDKLGVATRGAAAALYIKS